MYTSTGKFHYFDGFDTGDIIGLSIDFEAAGSDGKRGVLTFAKNGVSLGEAASGLKGVKAHVAVDLYSIDDQVRLVSYTYNPSGGGSASRVMKTVHPPPSEAKSSSSREIEEESSAPSNPSTSMRTVYSEEETVVAWLRSIDVNEKFIEGYAEKMIEDGFDTLGGTVTLIVPVLLL